MRFDDADEHIRSQLFLLTGGQEHRVGLADTGRGAEEDLQFAARGFGLFVLDACEESIGVGTFGHNQPRRRKRKKRNPMAPAIMVNAIG